MNHYFASYNKLIFPALFIFIQVGTGNDSDLKGLYDQYKVNVTSLYDNQNIAKNLGNI